MEFQDIPEKKGVQRGSYFGLKKKIFSNLLGKNQSVKGRVAKTLWNFNISFAK